MTLDSISGADVVSDPGHPDNNPGDEKKTEEPGDVRPEKLNQWMLKSKKPRGFHQ